MRAYDLMDDLSEDDEYSRVVPLRSATRGRIGGAPGFARRQPWTPRETDLPESTRRAEPLPRIEPRFTRTHRWMIASFAIICVGMILGLLLVRLWDQASRTVAAIPADEAAARAEPTSLVPPAPEAGPPAAVGTPVITTEIRVIQPNYTVAPGDTLGSIARRHGTSVDALASINNLENRNSLSVGQKLIIP